MFGSIGCGIDVNGLGMEQATLEGLTADGGGAEVADAVTGDVGAESAVDASVEADAGDPYAWGMAFCGITDAAACGLPARCGTTCLNSDPSFPHSCCCSQ